MKRILVIENLGCAQCAAKMENAIRKLDGVLSVNISFITQKLIIEAEEPHMDAILAKVSPICKKVEPDCRVTWNGKRL